MITEKGVQLNIVITDIDTVGKDDLDLSVFEQFGTVTMYSNTSQSELIERIKDADAIICNKTVVDKNSMDNAPGLKYIGLFATGYNNIDIEYAKSKKITVCNAGSYSTEAVAQQVFSYILNHYCRLKDFADFTAAGKWKQSPTFSPFAFPTFEVAGKNIGIIGYGNIGKKVAETAKAFNMNVYAYNRTVYNDESVTFTDLNTLLSISDIVTVHVPLNDVTKHMFNNTTFKKMKKNALFINTARGGIVDELALKYALDNKIIAAAAIDVLTIEPMASDNILFGTDNLIITPHTAWIPLETRQRLLGIVTDNLRNFIDSKPTNVVT